MANDNLVPASSSSDDGATDAQMKEVERLTSEQPSVEAALTNFMKLRMAKQMSGTDRSAAASLDPMALQRCRRLFLTTFNDLDLPQSVDWGKKYPQEEAESGGEYMSRLALFKVVRVLWVHLKSKGAKPSQMLGRSALQVVFPELEAKIFEDTQASVKVAASTEEQLRAFVDDFRSTLAPEDGAEAASDSELVWAANVKAAQAARSATRNAEASERVKRAESADDFADELRSAFEAAETSSVQVEEVDE